MPADDAIGNLEQSMQRPTLCLSLWSYDGSRNLCQHSCQPCSLIWRAFSYMVNSFGGANLSKEAFASIKP